MMANLRSTISYKLIPCISLLVLFSLSPKIVVAKEVTQALFVFGDSLFDAGNNPHHFPGQHFPTLHWPYGMAVNGASGRMSDGLLVPDLIAQLAGMEPVPPCMGLDPTDVPMTGCNAASAGSGALDHHPNAINLREQLRTVKEMIRRIENEVGDKHKVKDMLKKAVFLLSVGGNDYFSFSTNQRNATDAEIQQQVDTVMHVIQEALEVIYELGGRKFAFQDVGPLGCYPTFKILNDLLQGCDEFALKVASAHNTRLRQALHKWTLNKLYGDVKYGVFDYFHQLKDRMSNPTKYDFLVGDVACCGYGAYLNARGCGRDMYFLCSNPSAFVLFDGAHTTQKLNAQLAELMWIGDSHAIGPYNVKQLFEEYEPQQLKLLANEQM